MEKLRVDELEEEASVTFVVNQNDQVKSVTEVVIQLPGCLLTRNRPFYELLGSMELTRMLFGNVIVTLFYIWVK